MPDTLLWPLNTPIGAFACTHTHKSIIDIDRMLGEERNVCKATAGRPPSASQEQQFFLFYCSWTKRKKEKKSSLENSWHLISNFQPPDCEKKNEFALFCFVVWPIPEGHAGEEAENYYGTKTRLSAVLDKRLGWVKMDNFLSLWERKLCNKSAHC